MGWKLLKVSLLVRTIFHITIIYAMDAGVSATSRKSKGCTLSNETNTLTFALMDGGVKGLLRVQRLASDVVPVVVVETLYKKIDNSIDQRIPSILYLLCNMF